MQEGVKDNLIKPRQTRKSEKRKQHSKINRKQWKIQKMELSLSVAYYYKYDKFPYYFIQIQLKSNNTGVLLNQRDEKLFQLQECANRYQEK